jgi:hypothetical protein
MTARSIKVWASVWFVKALSILVERIEILPDQKART